MRNLFCAAVLNKVKWVGKLSKNGNKYATKNRCFLYRYSKCRILKSHATFFFDEITINNSQ